MTAESKSIQTVDVRLEGVSKSFGAVKAVKDFTADIPAGSFFSLLGPSGCGKSTMLRMIAGFETPDSGSIFIGGEYMNDRAPQKRPTAMVFQNYALFPHMTVGENVEYGLRVKRIDRRERKQRVRSALSKVDMDGFLESPVTSLSGGEQQRVALARAISIEPAVLLFDEPLSNLDVALREQTRTELKRIQSSIGTTSIYVTHDQEEALALSDRIAIMRDGTVIQTGSPQDLYDHPETAFVAGFLGGSNILDGQAALRISGSKSGKDMVLSVRPEHVRLVSSVETDARVTDRQYLGHVSIVSVEWEGIQIRAIVDSDNSLADNVGVEIRSYSWVKDDR